MVQVSPRLGALAVLWTLLLAAADARAWDSVHGNKENTGFVAVATAPAAAGSVSVPNIGSFARGVGPVISSLGDVYVGNEQGRLMAFHADGTPYWTHDFGGGERILSSAALGELDEVSVVTIGHDSATLHRFNRGGDLAWSTPIPLHGGEIVSTGAPQVIGSDARYIAYVPYAIRIPNSAVIQTWLAVISSFGAVALDLRIGTAVPGTTAGAVAATDFEAAPQPPVALYPRPEFVPGIIVSDGYSTLRTFRFDPNTETYVIDMVIGRATAAYRGLSAPTILPGNNYILGTKEGLYGEHIGTPRQRGRIDNVRSTGAPTLLPDGTILAIAGDQLNFAKDGQLTRRASPLPGKSFVSAAASASHFYVASEDAFGTYDNNTKLRVAKFDWVGGGRNPPAIGPRGHVYAIASNILFIFPPPKTTPFDNVAVYQPGLPNGPAAAVDGAATNPQALQPTSTQPQAQLFDPPMTANGNRLFACEALDQDDCGKGDYRSVALAFCQAKGFAKAGSLDVDSRKVTAETLDGRFCAKKKCKVFDKINCEN